MNKSFIKTYGCKVNQYESQALADKIRSAGGEIVNDPSCAQTVYINSCTVTREADRECRSFIRKMIRGNPSVKVVLTGCYALRAGEELGKEFQNILIEKQKDKNLAVRGLDSHSRAFVKIQDGCDQFCSYCIVPYVRPQLWSRPEDEILNEVSELAKNGYPEIVLTGIRLGKYNGGGGLVILLDKILRLGDGFRIRLSSLELSEVTGELLTMMAAEGKRICGHLHIPLQSGSDRILAMMKRPYNTAQFNSVLTRVRMLLPRASISTDVITGFPGETREDFEGTQNFIRQASFSRLHVFKYSIRESTAAASFENHIPPGVISERARLLKGLDAELQRNFWKNFIGRRVQVVRERGNNSLLTDTYIKLKAAEDLDSVREPVFYAELIEKSGEPLAVPCAC